MAQCTALSKRSGERCKGQAVTGSDKCRMHGAGGGRARKNADERAAVERARREAEKLAVPVAVDPGEALLGSLFKWHGWVGYWEGVVADVEGDRGRLYEKTYHQSGIGTGEAKPHVAYVLLTEAYTKRDAVAVALLKAGVEERRVRLAEGQAQMIAVFARGLLAELGIDPGSAEARAAFRKHLELVAGES